jgi:nicotinate-nucleotide adenylyltransferase
MVAEEMRQLFGFGQVLFVPSALPPHKPTRGIIPSRHRLIMATLATLDNPHFGVSPVEIERGGRSYTVDTLRELGRTYGKGVRLYFLVGSDAFLEISTWRDVSRLFELCRFVVIERPGVSLKSLVKQLGSGFFQQLGRVEYQLISGTDSVNKALRIKEDANVYLVQALSVDVSSSGIRALIRRGKSIKYLVHPLVEEYILKNRLYHPAHS